MERAIGGAERLRHRAPRGTRVFDMKAARVLGVALSVLGVGCSASRLGADAGADSRPATGMLDCDWVASANCLKATLTAAMSCVEPSTEIGVFNADSTTCTYPSGVVVVFDAPVQLPLGLNPPGWHFGVTRAGAECLRFDSFDNVRFTLTVNGNTLINGLTDPGTPLTIACPDGNRYTDSTDGGLLSCDPGGLATAGSSSGDSSGYFFIQLFPTDLAMTLFSCRLP